MGYRLTWKGDAVLDLCVYDASLLMAANMLAGEQAAKASLTPGHGYDTGSMQRRTHVAKPGYDWNSDAVKAAPDTAELGGKIVMPDYVRGKKIALELGCGQLYTIFYHQKYYPFLRIWFDWAMRNFKAQVENKWRMDLK